MNDIVERARSKAGIARAWAGYSSPQGLDYIEVANDLAEAASEIERLRASLSTMDSNHRKMATQLAEIGRALEQCRTSYCGYAITKSEHYPEVVANFWREIKRIDDVARGALEKLTARKMGGEAVSPQDHP